MSFIKSFSRGMRGLRTVLTEERNMRIHAVVGSLVVIFGCLIGLTALEWVALTIIIAVVVVLEVLNSIFERLIDAVKPSTAAYVADMKDMMASAVIIAALAAVLVGILIFGPRLLAVL